MAAVVPAVDEGADLDHEVADGREAAAVDKASEVDLRQSWPGAALVLPAGAEAFGLLHHHRPAVLGPGNSRGACLERVDLMSIFITTSMALLFSTVVACNSKEARTRARPGCSPQPGSIRSAREASLHAAPTRSLAARTAGSTRRSHRALRGRPWL